MKEINIASRGKVVRDPVHGLISFSPDESFAIELINTPEMQRLRRIRQLGVSSITYPGAEHSRFAHSLGVFCFAGKILDRLAARYKGELEILELIEKNEKTVKAAALLHDTGHGPFSHMLERAFGTHVDHEGRTSEIITAEDSKVSGILKKHKINPNDVRAIIDGTFPVWFLKDVVSSQLDADRMDYLLRDTLMTGVHYGRYDADWILNAICLAYDPMHRGEPNLKELRLCLDSKRGLHATEQLVVARMHMSYQVYYHRVTRSWEAHLLCMFTLAGKIAKDNALPSGTPEVVREFFENEGNVDLATFLRLDEAVMLAAFHLWSVDTKEEKLANFAHAFLNRIKIFEEEIISETNRIASSYQALKRLVEEGLEEGIDVYHDEARFKGYKDFGRAVTSRSDESSSEGILLASEDHTTKAEPVENHPNSVITKALSNDREATPLNRVFKRSNC